MITEKFDFKYFTKMITFSKKVRVYGVQKISFINSKFYLEYCFLNSEIFFIRLKYCKLAIQFHDCEKATFLSRF